MSPRVLEFGDFRLDATDHRLWRGSEPIRLTAKSFAVLLVLAQNAGRLVSKRDLFETVWAGAIVSDSALTSCVKEVRKALGDPARTPIYVGTEHGRGYRFIASVRDGAQAPSRVADQSRAPVPELSCR